MQPLDPRHGHTGQLAELIIARFHVRRGNRHDSHLVHLEVLHLTLGLGAPFQLVGDLQLQRHEAHGRHHHLLEDLALHHSVGQLRVVHLLQEDPRVGLVGRPPPLFPVAGYIPVLQQPEELQQLLQQLDVLPLRGHLELVAGVLGAHVITRQYLVLLEDQVQLLARRQARVERVVGGHLLLVVGLPLRLSLRKLRLGLRPARALLELLPFAPVAAQEGRVGHYVIGHQ
mmetsp:Transcript_82136/g.229595  ORF Transcript_82136/g.229595 Transcript_82136/m.229595 type:complete len:228 (-) Transcript_82136:882-1565(-)